MILSTNAKVAIARNVAAGFRVGRKVFGRGDRVQTMRSGVNWSLDLGEGIDFSIYLLGGFEVATLKRYKQLVQPGDVVLDIGANVGAHTLPLANLVGVVGHVHAFEPTNYAFGKLNANIKLNPRLAARITANQVLLDTATATILPEAIYSSWPLEKSSDLHDDHSGRLKSTEGAVVTSLDAYVKRHGLVKVDFVKLDVDGNELTVLKGGQATFAQFRPKIVIEMAPYVFEEENTFDEIVELFRLHGYRFEDLGRGTSLPVDADALRKIIPSKGGLNVLATAGEQ